MAPQTVNAGYVAVYDEVIMHGFDSRGSGCDAGGKLRSWWAPEGRRKFDERAACIATQFGGYEAPPGAGINGESTLAENIAGLGGLTVAYHAAATRGLSPPGTRRKR